MVVMSVKFNCAAKWYWEYIRSEGNYKIYLELESGLFNPKPCASRHDKGPRLFGSTTTMKSYHPAIESYITWELIYAQIRSLVYLVSASKYTDIVLPLD